jgi:CheY-like chemotaxis protein
VLVIDPLEETRAVLETVLSRRGVRIATAVRRDQGLRLAAEFRPDVVVLDCESLTAAADGDADSEEAQRLFADTRPEQPPSLILLGSARRNSTAASTRHVPKPYPYGPLISTIEELLTERRAA